MDSTAGPRRLDTPPLRVLADLTAAGLLPARRTEALADVVRTMLNTTAATESLPLDLLRDVPPASLRRAASVGQITLTTLAKVAVAQGWTIGDRALTNNDRSL